jgi:hypothetical protein
MDEVQGGALLGYTRFVPYDNDNEYRPAPALFWIGPLITEKCWRVLKSKNLTNHICSPGLSGGNQLEVYEIRPP